MGIAVSRIQELLTLAAIASLAAVRRSCRRVMGPKRGKQQQRIAPRSLTFSGQTFERLSQIAPRQRR